MIVTVTPNPSVDRTIGVARTRRGQVHQGTSSRLDPAGKGVNVARALNANDAKAVAVLPVGGAEGKVLVGLLEECGVDVVGVPIAEPIRGNVTISEPDGTTTKFNEPGPVLDADECTALLAGVSAALSGSPQWLVGCGSLPGGLDDGFYARLVRVGHRHGVAVAVDTSGPALVQAAAAGADLLKPNVHELEQAHAGSLRTLGDVVDAAHRLLELGRQAAAAQRRAVVVSLGRHGAVLVRPGLPAVHAFADAATPRSTVGAGDALLAGYLFAQDSEAQDEAPGDAQDEATGDAQDEGQGVAGDVSGHGALVAAVAWGTAAVGLPGSRMPAPADVAGVHVRVETRPELELPIHE
ncbi:1-phosphofructokinase family hexose kinase [Phytoactinopolyspora endophytica]|uniref:1-phosphofructokinase family hexose kinase n=1 Tax=Phytoactinopolyspora endophytica TaxID=1642495 RepID=UPI00101BAA56|nr:hexose kinase [Phytoactinopolyspora endophytica]